MPKDHWPTTHLSLLLRVHDPRENEAWGEFVNRYQPHILALIRDVFRLQPQDADDVAQDVLLKTVRAMQTFRYDSTHKFRSWLRTVTRNAVRDAFRSKQQQLDRASGDSQIQQLLNDQIDPGRCVSDRLEEHLYRDLLEEAELRVSQRVETQTWNAYLALKHVEGIPREVAEQLGMNVATVYKAKSKVIKMIREEVVELTASSRQ